jgi:hypothetical protein
MAETTLNKKMRAFDDEVALTIAQLHLVRMLQHPSLMTTFTESIV